MSDLKITFACIIFNGDYVLQELIKSIYPFAHKIIFVDGVVDYWASKGFTGSTDNTREIIKGYPDVENKIALYQNVVAHEKTELCRLFMPAVPEDTDYLWCIDSDEIFTEQGIRNVINMLQDRKPDTVSFRSNTFFGGFEYILGGFERDHNFKRILKYAPGCTYADHRPPTLSNEPTENALHIGGAEMADRYLAEMFHYSYVWPVQVKSKIEYYKAAVSKDNCINNYFSAIWLKWVCGNQNVRDAVEAQYNGVHEFLPAYRGPCRTMPFTGEHPKVIQNVMEQLQGRIMRELKPYIDYH